MKTLFICGSAEPGKDGVGDYCRKLCSALNSLGHQTQILALCDKHANVFIDEIQLSEEIPVIVKRIPISISNKERLVLTDSLIKDLKPDYISLQYVPYSFNTKGLPFWLPSLIKQLKGTHHWHIMFHECWIGFSKVSLLKHKIIGYFQRFIAKQIVNKVNPSKITTSNILYQYILESQSISADILPLFSNISKVQVDQIFKNNLLEKLNVLEEDKENHLFIGVFGSIYPESDIKKALEELLFKSQSENKKLVLITFGRIGEYGENELKRLKNIFSGKVQFLNCGELSENRISSLLQLLDIGISCTPFIHLGKSGVFAAMKLHELEVLISNKEEIPEFKNQIVAMKSDFINRPSKMWSVEHVAGNYLSLISN